MSDPAVTFTNTVPGFVEDLALVRIPPWWQSPWVMAVALVLLAGLGFAGVRCYRRWARRPRAALGAASGPTPGEAPEVWALRRLEELRATARQLGHYRFAIECSLVLRRFLEGRYELRVIYQTTREFLENARTSERLSANQRESLGQYLHFCDRVKFGRRAMDAAEMDQMVEYAVAFVRLAAGREAEAEAVALPVAPAEQRGAGEGA